VIKMNAPECVDLKTFISAVDAIESMRWSGDVTELVGLVIR